MEETEVSTGGKLRLNLLGEFSLKRPDNSEIVVSGQRKKAFIVLLAISPGKEISRENIISKLWSKRSLEQARASLRTLLNELGKTLRESSARELILKDQRKHTLRLNLDLVEIDVDEFNEHAQALTHEHRCRVLDIYRDDLHAYCKLNEDAFQDWLSAERIGHRELLRETLLDLLDHYFRNAEYETVTRIANRLLAFENTDELAHHFLMKTHAARGDKSALVKQYQACFDACMALVNEPPSHETTELFEALKSTKEPGASSAIAFTPPSSLVDSQKRGLSVAVTFFRSPDSIRQHVDRISSDVINALIRFKWMAVVPRGTMLEFRDQQMSGAQIGRNLKIEYVLDGASIVGEDNPQLHVELIDVVDDCAIWGQSYDISVPYDTSVSELLVGKIVNQIEIRLREKEVLRVLGNKDRNPNAYDLAWQAIHHVYKMTRASFTEARELFEKAERENYQYAPIYSWWALWQIFNIGQGWAANPAVEAGEAYRLAEKAYDLDRHDALALAIMGHSKAFLEHSFDEAIDCFDESLAENENSALAWTLSSATYTYIGEPDESLRRLQKAERLCPVEPHFGFLFDTARTIAYLCKRDYAEATRWGRKIIRKNKYFSNGYKPLVCALGHLGKTAEAREYLGRLLELEPDFNIDTFADRYPFSLESDREHYIEGLLKAGVPRTSPSHIREPS